MDLKWWHYVVLAGLAWGIYVPLIFFGGTALAGSGPAKPNHRLMAILCVGVAYFVLAVVVPVVLFSTGTDGWPSTTRTGLTFASLAGIAGAVGAMCVVFASSAAVKQAKLEGVDPATYRLFIAPLIFACAPVVNTIVSLVWHPKKDNAFHFGFTQPNGLFILGIVLVGLGVGIVLYAKESLEAKPAPAPTPAADVAPPAGS